MDTLVLVDDRVVAVGVAASVVGGISEVASAVDSVSVVEGARASAFISVGGSSCVGEVSIALAGVSSVVVGWVSVVVVEGGGVGEGDFGGSMPSFFITTSAISAVCMYVYCT